MKSGKGLDKVLTIPTLFFILIFSFYFNYEAGRRGFFPLDQSIVFDGSYRILKGQIPYKDFLIPVGPLPFYIHSLFFKIFGIKYTSYLLGSSFINAISSLIGFFIISLLFPSKKFLSLVGALITAMWFYPPSGTPYIEQTAFFLSLLAILLILFALLSKNLNSLLRISFLFFSGLFAFLTVMSKQNAGFIILPLYFLLIISFNIPETKKILTDSFFFLIGFVACILFFLFYLFLFSNFDNFWKYAVVLPFKTGMERLVPKGLLFILSRIGPLSFLPINIFFLLVSFSVLILHLYNFKTFKNRSNLLVASWVCLYLITFQYFFTFTTKNQPEMGSPFIGLVFAIGTGITFNVIEEFRIKTFHEGKELRLPSKRLTKTIFAIFFIVSGIFIAFKGAKVSLNRKAHDIFENSVFKETFAIEELRGMKWGEPTIIKGCEIRAEDIKNLITFLKEEKKNFFIFPDFTIFYGLLNSPPPQPILWFHKGLTYPNYYEKALDKWIVNDLKKNKVKILVLEECSWFGTSERLSSFPILKSFIEDSFKETGRIGIFIIYKMKEP